MSILAGRIVYRHGSFPCTGTGLAWSNKELDAAIKGPVAAVLFDEEGKANIEAILTGLADTEFAQEGLKRLLEDPETVEDWRVGEAIAETYLTHCKFCFFPWPDGRDERKSGSSLPGADLVGFGTDDKGDCLAFGEVKTSSQNRHPPSLMTGRTGLQQQMEDLRDCEAIRDGLLRYLGHRAKATPWRSRFEAASRRYLQNKCDVQLYGVLIRDVPPNGEDLRLRVKELGRDCPQDIRIELLALYLPESRMNGIGVAAIAERQRG